MLTEHFCILLVCNCFIPIRLAHAYHATGGVVMREAFFQGPHRFPRLDGVRAVRHAITGEPLGPGGFGDSYLRFERLCRNTEVVTVGIRRPVEGFHLGVIAGDTQWDQCVLAHCCIRGAQASLLRTDHI
eukprot:8148256-Ditylum_brightwellii.AAC.1